jgi:signal transduction histidine kinase
MKPWNHPSLQARFTWRMVAMQALVLMAFTSVAAIPVAKLLGDGYHLDDEVVEDIAESIERNAAGGLDFLPDADAREDAAEYPELWFYVTDLNGNSVQLGSLPPQVGGLLEHLPRLNSADISDIGSSTTPTAIVRRHESDAGSLWIITGGGPTRHFKAAFAAFGNPIFLGLLFLLTLVSFLVIPLIVRRQLIGVDHVAAQADTIDVDQRGVRLSSAHVPQELHSLVRAVNAALQRLDDGIERRQRFLADAAHELRTPIAILQTRLELLPDGADRSRLMLDVNRLSNLANQLLDLERLDADPGAFQQVNLVDLAAQVTADMAPLAIAAGDEISFDTDAETVTIAADPGSLSRALVNLVQNAIIHGGANTAIRVAVGRDGSLRVADSGRGIAEDHRQSIFEPFSRITPLDHGAGLGLNLVRDIVTRHQGQITVADAPGGGALFEIVLPLVDALANPGPGGSRGRYGLTAS